VGGRHDPAGELVAGGARLVARRAPALLDAVRTSRGRGQFLLSDLDVGTTRYQVSASLFYDAALSQSPTGAVGFLTDLNWVRQHYFGELLKQVESAIGEDGVRVAILDERGAQVAGSGGVLAQGVAYERRFPLAFFDRSLLLTQPQAASIPVWTLRVTTSAAARDARPWSLLWSLMLIAAVVSLAGLAVTVRSIRATAAVVAAQNEFVATATHDLKTPLAVVKVVGETLEFGRYTSENKLQEYGRFLRSEAVRLGLRTDNLLACARANLAPGGHRADLVDLMDVVHEALHRSEPRLAGFHVDANLSDAPIVAGDHAALLQVFDNLLDNAIKYSDENKRLSIRTFIEGDQALVTLQDAGIGISADDLPRVFDKFFTGGHGRPGTGLGLAIARGVLEAHGGTIAIVSTAGAGTTVTVRLPLQDNA
jgi:signal transduction histidine kinase